MEEHEKENEAKERSASRSSATDRAYSSVSFSLEKETEEPPPLPSSTLGHDWINPGCRQTDINMVIKSTLRLFIRALTSAAHCRNS